MNAGPAGLAGHAREQGLHVVGGLGVALAREDALDALAGSHPYVGDVSASQVRGVPQARARRSDR